MQAKPPALPAFKLLIWLWWRWRFRRRLPRAAKSFSAVSDAWRSTTEPPCVSMRIDGKIVANKMTAAHASAVPMWGRMASCAPVGNRRYAACFHQSKYQKATQPRGRCTLVVCVRSLDKLSGRRWLLHVHRGAANPGGSRPFKVAFETMPTSAGKKAGLPHNWQPQRASMDNDQRV